MEDIQPYLRQKMERGNVFFQPVGMRKCVLQPPECEQDVYFWGNGCDSA